MNDFKLYRDSFLNCYQQIISAMLLRQEINVNKIWTQAGLAVSLRDYYITPLYRNMYEDFKYNHGIEYWETHIDANLNGKQIIGDLNKLLSLGTTVGITLNTFELPYCMYYKSEHNVHMVEVIEINQEELTIADHFYNFYGQLPVSTFQLALNSFLYRYKKKDSRIFTVSKRKISNQSILTTRDVIKRNYQAMTGDIKFYETIPIKDFSVGIHSLDVLVDKIADLVDETDNLETMYEYLREIGNSRYSFGKFLEGTRFKGLIQGLKDSSQHWFVASNMLLMAVVKKDFKNIEPRVQTRFNKIGEQELENLNLMEDILNNSEGKDGTKKGF